MSRSIPDKEVKALITLSGRICAFPGCNKRLYEPGNAVDDAAFLARQVVSLPSRGPSRRLARSGSGPLGRAVGRLGLDCILRSRSHRPEVGPAAGSKPVSGQRMKVPQQPGYFFGGMAALPRARIATKAL